MTPAMYAIVAMVILPFLVRILAGRDSLALLSVVAVLFYLIYR